MLQYFGYVVAHSNIGPHMPLGAGGGGRFHGYNDSKRGDCDATQLKQRTHCSSVLVIYRGRKRVERGRESGREVERERERR